MRRLGDVILALVGASMFLAVPPCIGQAFNPKIDRFSLSGRTSAFTIETCETNPTLGAFGEASASFMTSGRYDYRYELLRGTTVAARDSGWIFATGSNQMRLLPPYSGTAPAVSGTYTLKLYIDNVTATGPAISFTLKQSTGTPVAKPLMNGDAKDTVAVCPGGPMTLDASQSACASGYFVGIELSDKNWSALGGGGGVWIGDKERQRYGQINSFDVKRFAEDRYIGFVGGQYYRVKLAVGAPWNEKTQLIYITPPLAKPLINGDANDIVSVCPGGPITLDGSPSVCASSYFVGIELSNKNSARLGGGGGGWIGSSEQQKYGPINSFNVKTFAEDRYIRFVGGQYYLVKLAIGPVWNERTQLLSIVSPVSAFTINGKAGDGGKVINVLSTDPIRLDGSGSTCAGDYFVSVQEADSSGKVKGLEVGRWLTRADFSKYGGSIETFDVKGFVQSLSKVQFLPGQYYKVKLAVNPPWHETTKLILIGDPCICTIPGCMLPASCQNTVF